MQSLTFEGYGGIHLRGDAFGAPDDPAVVLLPTAGQSRVFWHGAAQALAEAGRYAICVDLRGHGESDHAADGRYDLDVHAGDLRAILHALPSRAVVVAAGMSAIVALAAVGESAPHIVSGLAFVDLTIWFEAEQTRRLSQALTLRTELFEDQRAVLAAITAMHPQEPPPAAKAQLLAAFRQDENGRYRWRGDPRALAAAGFLGAEERLEAAARRLAVPVALIRGQLNESISAATVQRLQALIPGAEIAEVEGAGHYAATDREETFNAILLDFLERKVPRVPFAYTGGSEPRVLRDALGCFATGVTIVTTHDQAGAPIGLTANSFTSVSLDPPLILFSLDKNSGNLQSFTSAGRFAVNVLQIGQQPAANTFARRDAPRFESIDWAIREADGSPIISGALASFDCHTWAVHDGGDHVIFIGEVKQAWFEPHRDPLLYFRGKYRRLHFS